MSQVRKHHRKGRRPWYTFEFCGRERYLGTDPAKAHAKAAAIMRQAGVEPQAPGTVAGLIRAWHEETGRPIYWLGRWGRWCRKPLAEFVPADLQAYADTLTRSSLSAHTVHKYIAQARLVWKWGVTRGWIPCEPGKTKTARPLLIPRDADPAKLAKAISRLNPRARAVASFILATGCRPSESRLLRWEQVDLRQGVCVLVGKTSGKTGLPRTIYLTRPARKILSKQPRVGDWVFPALGGKPYTKDGLHSVLERVGIKNVYSLRHTFSQWFLDHGGDGGQPGDRAELSALLGHADGRMVDVYAQVRDHRLRRRASRLIGPAG